MSKIETWDFRVRKIILRPQLMEELLQNLTKREIRAVRGGAMWNAMVEVDASLTHSFRFEADEEFWMANCTGSVYQGMIDPNGEERICEDGNCCVPDCVIQNVHER